MLTRASRTTTLIGRSLAATLVQAPDPRDDETSRLKLLATVRRRGEGLKIELS